MTNEEKNFRKFKKGPIVAAAVFLVLACFALWYVLQEIQENKIAADEVLEVWRAEEIRRNELKSLQIFMKNTEAQRLSLDSHFALPSNVVPFLDTLESLGRQAGADAKVQNVETPGDGRTLVVTLRAEGSFEAVYKLLELFENSPYPLEFLALDLGSISEDNGGAGWEGLFKIRLLTFLP